MNLSRGTAQLGKTAQLEAGAKLARAANAAAVSLPDDPLVRPERMPRVSGTPALLLLSSLIVSMLAASAAPTPLYAIYQREWGFTPITTTIVFGIYAVAVLVSLLFAGRLSDYAGRRPVLLGALAGQVVALLVYATAAGVPELTAARVIQGLSTGAALGAIGAGLLDVSRERGALANSLSPGIGTGSGALLSALFIQFLRARAGPGAGADRLFQHRAWRCFPHAAHRHRRRLGLPAA